jgi:MFS family permease
MYASGMVTGGRLGDLLGYRRMFMIGVASFAVGSLLCGLAQSPAELVGARLLQGLTGAAMVPQVLALITATFPVAERSRALAWFGVTMGLAFVLGGLLLQANVLGLGWRAIFLVNVPVGAAALIAAALVVPHARSHRRPRLDPAGAAGVSGSVALALVPLTLGHNEGWPVWTWICLAACLPAFAVTMAWQRRLIRRGGGAALAHVPPERAGAAAGILTTTQQFGVASGVAIIGAVFYTRLGPGRASSVSAMELAMTINAVVALAAAALTLLLPRRARRPRAASAEERTTEYATEVSVS